MIVELPGCCSDAVAGRDGDFAIAAEGAAGSRDGSAGTLSYIIQGSQSAHVLGKGRYA